MKKRKELFTILSCLMCGFFCFLLTSCSGTKSESDIKTDIPDEYKTITVDGVVHYLEIDDFTIDRRRVEKEEGFETVYCTAELSDETYETTFQYVMEYLYYDKGGWILDAIWIENRSDVQVSLVNEFPDTIAEKYLNETYSSYSLTESGEQGEHSYYATYDVGGSRECLFSYTDGMGKSAEDSYSVEFEGTITLSLVLKKWEGLEYRWEIETVDKQLWWAEEIPVETATTHAQMIYPSAEYKTNTLEENSDVQTFVFEVNETNLNNSVSGEFVLQYVMSYMNDDGTYFDGMSVNIEKDDGSVVTNWNITGTWCGEFVRESTYSRNTYSYFPLTFTIEAITSDEIILTEGYQGEQRVNSLDGLVPEYDFPLEDLRVPYEKWGDGTISFELEYVGVGQKFTIIMGPNSNSCRFPWLYHSVTELTHTSG